MQARITLLTNIEAITIIHKLGNIRAHARALVLVKPDPSDPLPGPTIRAFGMDSAWPVFDIWAESTEYVATRGESAAQILRDDGSLRSLTSGSVLLFAGGQELHLAASDHSRPIDVTTFEGEHSETYAKAWASLTAKANAYYTHDGAPHLFWGPHRRENYYVAAGLDRHGNKKPT